MNDTWYTRDLLVLHAIAELETTDDANFGLHDLERVTGFDLDDIRRSLVALEHEYVAFKALPGDGVALFAVRGISLLGSGRRAIGQWPGHNDESPSDQAGRVRAWVELLSDPPRLVVGNSSGGVIRSVSPSVYLKSESQPAALVGGTLSSLAELASGYSFVWELVHFRSLSQDPSVRSSLHVQFDDQRGQRWELGHSRLVPVDAVDPSRLQYVQPGQVPIDAIDTGAPSSQAVGAAGERLAYLAYMHEDASLVDRLQTDLEGAGITAWRDRDQLLPGDDLGLMIREAIEHRALAFIPCFSDRYLDREKTYMNAELSVALEEIRLRGQAHWFMPVRFSNCAMPDLDLGLGRRLKDVIWANLFEDWDREVTKLIRSIRRRV